jgi:Flp pilus assembly protein TadD
LEHALAGSPGWRRLARWGWCLLLIYSIVFNVFASVKTHAAGNYFDGNSFFNQNRMDEAVEYYQRALALEPGSAAFHVGLGRAYCRKGRLDEAIMHFQKALEIEPGSVEAQYDLGCSLLQARQVDKAVVHFQQASQLKPDFTEDHDAAENNNFAWLLATNPEAGNSNGAVAVMLAEGACRRTHHQVTAMVGTLAAAYAEAGRFEDAISTAQKACALAEKNGETNLLQKNRELLQLYQNHKPYHEASARSSDE